MDQLLDVCQAIPGTWATIVCKRTEEAKINIVRSGLDESLPILAGLPHKNLSRTQWS